MLEFEHFLGAFQKRGIDFADADKNHVTELALEQLRDRDQSREAESVEPADQNCCG